MTQDIASIISMIDKKINALNQAKQTLIAEFGNGNQTAVTVIRRNPVVRTPIGKITQRDKVINALRNYGPLSRKEISEKTDVPVGTIANVLNDKTTFISKDGKWHLVGQEEAQTTIDPAIGEN
jgi:hypothetical protein